MRRKVYRPWIQALLLFICFSGFFLIALSGVTVGGVIRDVDVFGIIVCTFSGAFGLYGMWRASRLGVAVTSEGLQVRSFGRDKVVPWSQIEAIAPEMCDSRFGIPVFAPVISITSTTGETEWLPITAMGSYRERDAHKRAEILAEYKRRYGRDNGDADRPETSPG